jgi:hypothetical protein
MDYSEDSNHAGGGFVEYTKTWEFLAQPTIVKMLYKLLTRLDRHQPLDWLDADTSSLYELCRFVANHSPTLPWSGYEVISDGFPDLRELLDLEAVSEDEKHDIQQTDFEELISLIVEEYQPDLGSIPCWWK